jgi:serine/threonine protein kinase
MSMSKIGPYTLETLLGEGGMGQVFRAHDSRLGRAVAIKVVRQEFTGRFEREAHAIAALNHPHVCTLYDIGPNYLAMEFVEGQSLAGRLASGKLTIEQTLAFGAQIASALAAAHARGIVHRDLKPANIMLAKTGVKVLDFGLAKLADRPESVADPTLTAANAVMGTPAYIAPEHWRGAPADARADLYALGVLLHEMATGTRPSPGEGPRPNDMPARLRDLVERCLNPDPEERWQSARDLQTELEWIARDLKNPATPVLLSRGRWPLVVAVSCALAVLAAAAALAYLRPPATDLPVRVTTILPPENTRFDFARSRGPAALSPDGRSMVFTAIADKGERQLWIRALDAPLPVPLPGTADASFPFWSPDSRWVGFYAGGFLKKIDTHGGGPISLTAVQGSGVGGSWSSKGQIVFSAGGFSPLQKIPAEGGTPALATATDVSGHGYPWFLPDGEHFLFTSWPGAGRATLRLGSLSSTTSTIVGPAESHAIYADGRLLYLRGNSLVAQPFDLTSLRTTGDAVLVAEPVQRLGSLVVTGVFSASQTGLLAYQKGTDTTLSQLTWFDRAGNAIGTLGNPTAFFDIRLSPDRKSLLASAPDAVGNFDLWAFDLARGLMSRFTTDAGGEYYGVWSADGRTVIFNSTRRGNYDLFRKAASGAASEELVFADATDKVPTSLSSDGRYLLYYTGGGQRFKLWRLRLSPEHAGGRLEPEPLLDTPFNERWAQFSPDDRWIAYETDESGRTEIYAAPSSQPTAKYRISSGGGHYPRWRHDGQAVLYQDNEGQLQEAVIRIARDTLDVTSVRPVFASAGWIGGYAYDLSGDAQKALIVVPMPRTAEPLTLVENWTAIER